MIQKICLYLYMKFFSRIFLVFVGAFLLSACNSNQIGASIIDPETGLEAGKPDLVLTKAELLPVPAAKDKVLLRITVENKGTADVNDDVSIYGVFTDDPDSSTKILTMLPLSKNGLKAGSSTTLEQEFLMPRLTGKEGTYHFSIDSCPDPSCRNRVQELNEENNDQSAYFSL